MYHTYSHFKSVYAELFNRTLKDMMYRHFKEHNTDRCVEILNDLIIEYNNKVHSVTKPKPNNIYLHIMKPHIKETNEEEDKFYEDKYRVRDYVRVSKMKKTFEKGYTTRWSNEVFKVVFIDTSQRPYMYGLEDLLGEEVKGNFYAEELQKTNLKDLNLKKKSD